MKEIDRHKTRQKPISVAPNGRIVFLNTVAQIHGVPYDQYSLLVDKNGAIDPKQCFQWDKRFSDNIEVLLQEEKYISHVQLLPSQDPHAGEFVLSSDKNKSEWQSKTFNHENQCFSDGHWW